MNIIDLILLLLLFVSIAFGIYRGAVSTLFGLAAGVLSFPLAFWLAPYLTNFLGSNPAVIEMLASYTDASTLVGNYSLATTTVAGISESSLQAVINSLSLPQSILSILHSNMLQNVFASSGLTTVNDYVTYTIVVIVLQAVCFIVAYLGLSSALHFIITLVNHVFAFPVLKYLDGVAGGILGLLRGMLILYVLFLIVPVLRTVIPLDLVPELFEGSSLASVFSSSGFFIRVVTGR